MTINQEKTKIIINGDLYNLSDIELIYTQNNKLFVCTRHKKIEYGGNCDSDFKDIAVQFILNKIDNFLLLITGNNIVNVSTVNTINYDTVDMTIETKNHTLTLQNISGIEYMVLAERVKQSKQNYEITKN